MKKYASSILLLVVVAAFMLGFAGCQNLLPDKLMANQHLIKANSFYSEEKYKLAVDEYEMALKLNPELKSLYLYLGTSYSALYKPGKTDDRNKLYGDKAAEYLLKAREAFPDKEEIIYALGDIYDKMGNFEEAEKYYLKILEKSPNEPKSYYIVADFYSKYNKFEEAKAMYEKRIALDPKAPDGYLYYAGFGSDRRQWDLSIENHQKRILALYDPDALMLKIEIDQMKKDLEQVIAIKKNMDLVRQHKSLDQAEKTRLLGESQERLNKFKSEAELTSGIPEKEKQLETALANKWTKINALNEEQKNKLAEAFQTLGAVCWNKSYQTPPEMMSPQERMQTVELGLEACNDSLKINPENYQVYGFVGLLWRQKIVADPLKNDYYMSKWQEAFDKAKELGEKQLRRKKLQDQLDKMGKAE
ncbi:MAG: tetratricopeptide repeat protein [Acidobacteria bacterium]|jgi:tetratricopeptide (TPR) repeat protein|nr:tetratricopeptide repeat protein [Acidobacteriota bacterium]